MKIRFYRIVLCLALTAGLFGCGEPTVIDNSHVVLNPKIQVFGEGNVCVTATCVIRDNGTQVWAGGLAASLNQISFDPESGPFMVIINKEGYKEYRKEYDFDTMNAFRDAPLLVTLESLNVPDDGLIKVTYAILAEVNSTNPFVRADTYSSTVQTVYINTPFAMGNSEVTFELWDEISGWGLNHQPEDRWYIGLAPFAGAPGTPYSDDHTQPVTWISWHDAARWCNAYSEMTGRNPVYFTDNTFQTVYRNLSSTVPYTQLIYINWAANGYRMPSEAEWEFCARYAKNGSGEVVWTDAASYSGSTAIGEVGWYKDNANNATKPVKSRLANYLGFYDMTGNVTELCSDYFWIYSGGTVTDPHGPDPSAPAEHIMRGGNIFVDANWCQTGFRYYTNEASGPGGGLGFRLARTIHE